MLTYLEAENMRGAPDECLMNLEEPIIEEVPYEKELERAKPTISILPTLVHELTRKIMNIEESDSHMTHAQFT
jgi:hypothetical protein